MSAPLTFLGGAVVAWIAVRAAASALAPVPMTDIAVPPAATPLLDDAAAMQGAVPPAQGATMPPGAGYPPPGYGYPPPGYAYPPGYPPPGYAYPAQAYAPAVRPQIVYVPYAVPAGGRSSPPRQSASRGYPPPSSWAQPPGEGPYDGVQYAENDPYPRSRNPAAAPERFRDPAPGTPTSTPALAPGRRGLDRFSVSSWALLRPRDPLAGVPGGTSRPAALAPVGQLGGSQAGLRLTYRVNRALSINARFSAPADQQKLAGEGALGIGWQPLQSIPVRLLAERRQALGKGAAGRNAFALLAEGGVSSRPLPLGFLLDGYAQGGVVGLASRDLFADGGFALTRPLLGRFAIGGGAWGGVQPGLSRLDVGPRVSMRGLPRIRAHVDYRVQLLGNARPGTGPAVTLAGDF